MQKRLANATNNTVIWVVALASAGAYRKDLSIKQPVFVLLFCLASA
ncbi:hypothetical protein GNE08_22360 [Trichormus variabilis ARAD]|uniref:Transposase n=1 Tax=Trichormus variabilis N2B TaxID=2681315 RepID=A0ABR6S295_ANAVA|nr:MULTISPECIES: hypothetical protein [Nostocaceae]MBC1216953.1 hypothetical protein [Trichormus variabilis ARAD]MBC1256670.1 hypothetical protein [Trichormus variabilis V5]MBC1266697.1 hypothetical protein [Trichormus variabilis FSR]MBC1300508.1 hypothetical protein [Trichormus variabilis N2B]MBC1310473.1 hypothetical protein [Trichormus variabilis PNB]